MTDEPDPYARLSYRRLIAWPARIEREGPLLEEVLGRGPVRRVVELGSGTGEHARFLVAAGFEVVGIDRSPAQVEAAADEPLPPGLTFVEGDLREADRLVEGRFGSALCLGNTLPHLAEPADLEAVAAALERLVEPGGPVLLQILNYDRIFARRERALPVNLRPDPDEGEIVFLRLMDPDPETGRVVFYPSTLRLRPDGDPPLEVVRSRRVELRGWRRREIEAAFRGHGFERFEAWGGFAKEPFDPEESRDLVLVAWRDPSASRPDPSSRRSSG